MQFILCADDFAYNAACSKAILALLAKKRLSATSCMTNMPAWHEQAIQLSVHRANCDVGLHFNLTDGAPLSTDVPFSSLSQLLIQSHLHRLNRTALIAELQAQLDAFETVLGCLPDFIDGHQHIHHLPVVRDALLTVYHDRLQSKQPYIRISSNGWRRNASLKSFIITASGAMALKRQLEKNNIPHNDFFAGMYDFSLSIPYRERFQGFLKQLSGKGLIMCHPGLQSDDGHDDIAKARVAEYDYLMSDAFLEDCDKQGVSLVRGI